MDPIVRGAMLGIANVLVIALGIALKEHGGFEAFCAMAVIGTLPALIAGILIGAIAERSSSWPVVARLLVMIPPALFEAVAEVLAYLIRLKQLALG